MRGVVLITSFALTLTLIYGYRRSDNERWYKTYKVVDNDDLERILRNYETSKTRSQTIRQRPVRTQPKDKNSPIMYPSEVGNQGKV